MFYKFNFHKKAKLKIVHWTINDPTFDGAQWMKDKKNVVDQDNQTGSSLSWIAILFWLWVWTSDKKSDCRSVGKFDLVVVPLIR